MVDLACTHFDLEMNIGIIYLRMGFPDPEYYMVNCSSILHQARRPARAKAIHEADLQSYQAQPQQGSCGHSKSFWNRCCSSDSWSPALRCQDGQHHHSPGWMSGYWFEAYAIDK